jgi:branched-subunit amino acid ABC-type transport system permease component
MGMSYTIIAIIVVVLGGMGSVLGSLLEALSWALSEPSSITLTPACRWWPTI